MSLRVMNWVWERSTAAGNARLVLLALADHADDTGRAFPSIQRIAARAQLSERTVQRMITKLADVGEISVARSAGGRTSNTYIIHFHDPQQEVSHLRLHPSKTVEESASTSPRPQLAGKEQTPQIEDGTDEAAGKVLDRLPWRLGRRARKRLSPLIHEALTAGWSADDLASHLAANPEGVRMPDRLVAARLDDLPPPPLIRPIRPAWCGTCDQATRLIELPDGRPARCTTCHPSQQTKAS